jgi:hypothetical protein
MKRLAPSLKYLIVLFVSFSLIVTLFDKLAKSFFSGYGLIDIFGISSLSFSHLFIWQPLTYFFIEPSDNGLSFGFLLNVFFDAYLLSVIGTSLVDQLGQKTFVKQTLISAITLGFLGLFIIKFFATQQLLLGPQPLIYCLLILWLSFNPMAEFFLLIALKLKARLIIFALIGIGLLSSLSDGRFVDFFVLFGGVILGYVSSTFIYGIKSPFFFMNKIDKVLIAAGKWTRKIGRRGKPEVLKGKIIDIRSLKD